MVKIHFLNVGHGDCTIIEHQSGNLSMIDINNGGELDDETAIELSEELKFDPLDVYKFAETGFTPYEILKANGYNRDLTNPIEFIKINFPNRALWRFIVTHPDMDHLDGIKALEKERITIHNLWDTDHHKTIPEEDFVSDSEKYDWEHYNKIRKGGTINVLQIHRGTIGKHYNQHPLIPNHPGDGLYILAPTPDLVEKANANKLWNNLSYVLMLIYADIKILFGGDAEKDVWDSIVKAYSEKILSSHILKASHHGRDTGYHEEAVSMIKPLYTIVSVGKKPETDASNKYKKHTLKEVWSTRWKGNITLEIYDYGKFSIKSQYDN